MCEQEDVSAHVTKLAEQIQTSFREATEEGANAPSPEDLFVGWGDVAERLAHAVRLEQLAIQEQGMLSAEGAVRGAGAPGSINDIACQPAVEFRGAFRRIADVKRMREGAIRSSSWPQPKGRAGEPRNC